MSRRYGRSRKKSDDEANFPVRVRIHVPEEGLGKKLDLLFAWLDASAGRENWDWNSDSLPGRDAMSIYLYDPNIVPKMLGEFDLTLSK